jgi:hypothetical protein
MSTAYPPKGETPKEQRARIGRRQLLKTLITAGGVAAASTLLPGRWVKPLVEVGVLPAHAQASAPTPMCYTPTPSHTPTPSPMCYTPTPSHTPASPTPTLRCYTVGPLDSTPNPTLQPSFAPASQDRTPQPPASPTPEARQELLEKLLAEGRFPRDVASKLQAGEN